MARRPNPVRPRRMDEKAYEKAIRRVYVNPMFAILRSRLANAQDITATYHALRATSDDMLAAKFGANVEREVREDMSKLRAYHKRTLQKQFAAALGVDISLLLTEPEIESFMRAKIIENVDLIKTIPPRMHDSLKGRLQKLLAENPFDQSLVRQALRDEYGSTGYNLRRLTRDQTQKTIAGLTEIRHSQLGIEPVSYTHLTLPTILLV